MYGECECFVMQMLYVCVLCASCGSSQCCVLHDLQFVNAGRQQIKQDIRLIGKFVHTYILSKIRVPRLSLGIPHDQVLSVSFHNCNDYIKHIDLFLSDSTKLTYNNNL